MTGAEGLIGGRFRTIRRLGAGGMGSVALAEDVVLRRFVAIKRLHPGSGPELAQRFRQEMKVSASMRHPNIVGLLDAIEEDGDVVLVMEYVDGAPLSQRLREGPVGAREAMALLRPLGEAVDAIHARGVVHRDIKPSNILISSDGTPKLADLGLARAADRSGLTTTSAIVGTPTYLAPELFDHAAPSPATDLWSLAAVAFEVLGGRRARAGTTPAAIAFEATRDVPVDLSERFGHAPALEDVLRRGLDRDPAARPPSGRALMARIAEALGQADSTRPAAATRAADPPPRRRRSPGPALVAGLGTIAVGAIVALIATGGSGGGERAASTTAQRSTRTRSAPSRAQTTTKPRANALATAAAATPGDAVKAFYTRAAAHDYKRAWALAAPGVRSQLAGFDAFVSQFRDVRRIDFRSLSATGTTVSFATTATHTDHVEHCTGTAATAKSSTGDGYLVSHLAVSCPGA